MQKNRNRLTIPLAMRGLSRPAFILPALIAALALAGCASDDNDNRSPAENLYVIDHNGDPPSGEELRPYETALSRVARTCGASEKVVSNYTVGTVDKIREDTRQGVLEPRNPDQLSERAEQQLQVRRAIRDLRPRARSGRLNSERGRAFSYS